MRLKTKNNKIFIVTGLSGAGRSTGLKILEDLGYEAIDNLPIFLLPTVIDAKIPNNIAIGIDIRSREFDAKRISKIIKNKKNMEFCVVFFDCENEILLNRYKESRRTHPFKMAMPIIDVINKEREWLEPLRKASDYYIDTTNLTSDLLKKQMVVLFKINKNDIINIRIISFGYKYGLPREADLVFDMRFLKNPFYQRNLKKLNGKDQKVKDFVTNQKSFINFFETINKLFEQTIEGFGKEGRDYITLAFGCTGGVHRSVASGELFYQKLKKKKTLKVHIDHRDMKK